MTASSRPFRLACCLVLVLGLPPPAGADTVSGYILDPVAQQRVGGVEVAFLVDSGNGLAEMARRTSDGAGQFAFSGPFLATGTTFGLVANYEGLEYASDRLVVGDQDEVILEVYAATDDDRAIRIDGHNLFLSLTPAGVDVAHLARVDNIGDRTYAGRPGTDGVRLGLAFALPAEAAGFEDHSGELLRAGASRVYATRPLPPGETQVAFAFHLEGDDFDGEYRHEVLWPTEWLDLFLQPATVALGKPFEDLGEVAFHDQTYRHYRVGSLEPGRVVTVPLPVSRSLRWALKWAMLTLVPAILIGALAVGRSTAGAGPGASASQDLATRRQALLLELTRLDEALGAARPEAADELRRQREHAKSQLIEIYRQLDRERG